MNKMKFFTLFAFLLFIFIGFRTYSQYNDIQNTEKIILLNEGQSLAKFVLASNPNSFFAFEVSSILLGCPFGFVVSQTIFPS